MTPDAILQEINKLKAAEKMLLLEKVCDSISLSTDDITLPQWQRDELDRRFTEHRQHREGDLPSHEFLQQVRNSL